MTKANVDIRQGMYAPIDGGIGDFCIVRSEDGWHCFHLYREFRKRGVPVSARASRGVDRRIGHAFSTNLVDWQTKRPALQIDPGRSFEDLMLWAPSVIHHMGTWYMFYTGVSQGDHSVDTQTAKQVPRLKYSDRLQSICLATSQDLQTWKRVLDKPAIDVRKPGWAQWSFADNKDCRDPYVVRQDDGFLLYYTSFATGSPSDQIQGRPIIAAAFSKDLLEWRDLGAVMKYRVWDKDNHIWVPLESPCVFKHRSQYYLFWNMYEAGRFCCFWTVSKDPLKFDGEVNLFADHLSIFRNISYEAENSHFAAFTNEYFGVLRFYRLDWSQDYPQLYVEEPHYDD